MTRDPYEPLAPGPLGQPPIEIPVQMTVERREPPRPRRRRVLLPLVLFLATCWTTYTVGGPVYAACLMATLLAHEMGHFLQAVRYHVPASLPFFIPIPLPPLGTMGAVIGMAPGMGNRRALFDIAITGPLAGLVLALVFSVVGLQQSRVGPALEAGQTLQLGEPLLFKALSLWTFGPLPEGQDVFLNDVAFAGWVGIFITGLNLIPIGQLDGGHILYALLRRRAHGLARALLVAAAVGVVLWGYWGWTLMLMLLFLMGPEHPPTADDQAHLGTTRIVLGWLALAFVVVGFTPTPFVL